MTTAASGTPGDSPRPAVQDAGAVTGCLSAPPPAAVTPIGSEARTRDPSPISTGGETKLTHPGPVDRSLGGTHRAHVPRRYPTADGRLRRMATDPRRPGLRLDSLTGLRFFAAFAVFGFHALRYGDQDLGTELFAAGATGVSFFFVVSGFVDRKS